MRNKKSMKSSEINIYAAKDNSGIFPKKWPMRFSLCGNMVRKNLENFMPTGLFLNFFFFKLEEIKK